VHSFPHHLFERQEFSPLNLLVVPCPHTPFSSPVNMTPLKLQFPPLCYNLLRLFCGSFHISGDIRYEDPFFLKLLIFCYNSTGSPSYHPSFNFPGLNSSLQLFPRPLSRPPQSLEPSYLNPLGQNGGYSPLVEFFPRWFWLVESILSMSADLFFLLSLWFPGLFSRFPPSLLTPRETSETIEDDFEIFPTRFSSLPPMQVS